jgi:2-oxoglutarate dehydrogenase E1 component
LKDPEQIKWLQDKIESKKNKTAFSLPQKKQILKKLNQAVIFESFLDKKYVGQKRFSLQGAETLIPALDASIEKGSELGCEEFVVGMAHRGRLNVLANIFYKTYKEIFSEFESKDYDDDSVFDGDVKYHLGYSTQMKTDHGSDVKLTLAPNPSHLEAVDPVVGGISRAKIDKHYNGDNTKVCPVLIHGDAAVAAQGIVYEVTQMADLEAYSTGGTLHIVINNQVGFTTNYLDARSSIYCTDIAKVTQVPVFHVNGDDAEALVHAMNLAMEWRQKYHTDVFIDLLCYRKHGHNEGDEPRYTQPILYKAIAKHPDPRSIYVDKLLNNNDIEGQLAKDMQQEFQDQLSARLDEAKEITKGEVTHFMEEYWEEFRNSTKKDIAKSPTTGVSRDNLEKIAKALSTAPEGKKFIRKVLKELDKRGKMFFETDKLDWGMAEMLAYGSVLLDGNNVRFTGQDVERGTFSHRHAVIKVEDSEEEYRPLNNISPDQKGSMGIYNSLLSEYGVLGYEYGYALASPYDLVIWEAQFGDFNNGAQIIIDQFLVAGEDKWKTQNGLVMLLPHGYEGMGAEHSSGRMERFLQLCAHDNMQILNCTTPANFFHAIRRQMNRPFRKPMIVFTPKKLLRYPSCVSSVSDLTEGNFQELIADTTVEKDTVDTVILCNGKIYYELDERREELKANNIAIMRVEQLYPFPQDQIDAQIKSYKNMENLLWVQEEPENMGAWWYVLTRMRETNIQVISRARSAAPATGSGKRHQQRTEDLFNEVFKYAKVKA